MSLNLDEKPQKGVRPYNEDGLTCPLRGQPTKKVCHKCTFWQPIKLLVNGQVEEQWRCSINWTAAMTAKVTLNLESVEAEIHKQNDQAKGFLFMLQNAAAQAHAQRLTEEVIDAERLEAPSNAAG